MIMCVLLCYPVSIRTYYQQGVLFLVHYLSHKHPDVQEDLLTSDFFVLQYRISMLSDVYSQTKSQKDLYLLSVTRKWSRF